MKKFSIIILAILNVVTSFGQKAGRTMAVIPIPDSVQMGNGNFVLTKTASIQLKSNDADTKRVAGFLSKKLSAPTGFAMAVESNTSSNSNGNILISLNTDP